MNGKAGTDPQCLECGNLGSGGCELDRLINPTNMVGAQQNALRVRILSSLLDAGENIPAKSLRDATSFCQPARDIVSGVAFEAHRLIQEEIMHAISEHPGIKNMTDRPILFWLYGFDEATGRWESK